MRKRRTTPRSNISKNASISKQLAATLPDEETQSTRKIQAANVEEQKPSVERLSTGRPTLVSDEENYLSSQAPPKPIISLEHPTSTTSTSKVATAFPHILLDDLWIDILSFFAQVYLTLYKMTLGFEKWWAGTETEDSHRGKEKKEKEVKAKRRRRRVEPSSTSSDSATGRFFPGMVNLSGTLCYMNSVLQSVASIPSLIIHLEKVIDLAVEVDMPTHVTDALLDVIRDLNTPNKRPPPALRPHNLLTALYPLPAIRRLLGTHEQQDAHELFLVLAEAVSDEVVKVAAEVAKVRGIGEIISLQGYLSGKNDGSGQPMRAGDMEGAKRRQRIRGVAQPWEGLLARRRVCQRCGWSEAIRMDTLGGIELPVPLHGNTTLDACIMEYLAPEILSDVTCEMCSLNLTLNYYTTEVERLSGSSCKGTPKEKNEPGNDSQISSRRKKRAREARRAETRLREMVNSNTVSDFGEPNLTPLPSSGLTAQIPVKWLTAKTASTRQCVIVRPPQSLQLHFIRSEFTMYGTVQKKTAKVSFPLLLDLTRFVSDGVWEERSGIKNLLASVSTEKTVHSTTGRRVIYQLESAILHYGFTHSSGHFVSIRRKPSPPLAKDEKSFRPLQVAKNCPDGCRCQDCVYFGQVRDLEETKVPGRGWLRISDADVEEVGEEALHEAGGAVVMLFYERVMEYVVKKVAHDERLEGNGDGQDVGGLEDNI
ncbi:ubiquitin carboxyl-terminal hydrolase 1 [Cryptococcus neoformans]|nr:ubiquitin carboxyl-terminal hydrolase 1 [Cryptococcus neoformans var. grubii]OXC66560.1 ubiquitin carboxyl-terminal hydrolase 1 [Cryptococcus neoformans var. grubii MW-RSA852]